MKIHYAIDTLPPHVKTWVTMGTFDGLHLGHRSILMEMQRKAQEQHAQTVVLSFDPHPKKVLFPDSEPLPQIQSMEEKALVLEEWGIDYLVLLPFTLELAQLSATDFVRNIIVNGLHAAGVYMGYDHRFGKNRIGDIHLMAQLGDVHGFEVKQMAAYAPNGVPVSSTKIRQALLNGEIVEANKMLGRPFVLQGEVIKGQQLGSKIGFPTANIQVSGEDKLIPKLGVYAATIDWNNKKYAVALNVGHRPTVSHSLQLNVEAHILDFNSDIYGKSITLELHERLRDEMKMNGLDMLIEQIKKDVQWVKDWFASSF
jgi:riboflavin kinase/FMN adenylyltransferase